jgi:hypothetical protein
MRKLFRILVVVFATSATVFVVLGLMGIVTHIVTGGSR